MQTANVNVKVNATITTREKLVNVFGESNLSEFEETIVVESKIRHCNTVYTIVKKGKDFKYYMNKKDPDVEKLDDFSKRNKNGKSGKKMGRGAAIKRDRFAELYPGEDPRKYTVKRLENLKQPLVL